jgi:hypothetical protein
MDPDLQLTDLLVCGQHGFQVVRNQSQGTGDGLFDIFKCFLHGVV